MRAVQFLGKEERATWSAIQPPSQNSRTPPYLKNNTYLQQQDNKKPSDNYFSDIPRVIRNALLTLSLDYSV